MSETAFHFKQFTIHQDKCAMKVGTDAVLLGAWVKTENESHILDIGTGTGVIALMLAQKSDAHIDAIDIDENAFHQAHNNFLISPWTARLNCMHHSFQEFSEEHTASYDLIVTNPPYFHDASKPVAESRLNARHSEALTFDELVYGVKKLLKPDGRFCVILPCKEGMEFLDKAQRKELFCHHLLRIKTKADKNEKRLIMEFGFHFGVLTEEEIIIQEEDGSFTQDYIDLTLDYYLQLRQAPSPSHFQQS
jgi:tRNA1Val (adenine37-N6)-methyltransferase